MLELCLSSPGKLFNLMFVPQRPDATVRGILQAVKNVCTDAEQGLPNGIPPEDYAFVEHGLHAALNAHALT